MQNFFAAHFFHLLWNVQFFIYFGYMGIYVAIAPTALADVQTVIAGCVANWYFTPYKDNGKKPRGSGEGELPKYGERVNAHMTLQYADR